MENCHICGKHFDGNEIEVYCVDHIPQNEENIVFLVDNYAMCADCYEKEGVACSHCGSFILKNEACEYNGVFYCWVCYDENCRECRNCGHTYHHTELKDDLCLNCAHT